jgi:hypothetical protein
LNLGDGSDHAACCAGVSMICTPSRNLAPWMTLGKRFSPFSFRHVLALLHGYRPGRRSPFPSKLKTSHAFEEA